MKVWTIFQQTEENRSAGVYLLLSFPEDELAARDAEIRRIIEQDLNSETVKALENDMGEIEFRTMLKKLRREMNRKKPDMLKALEIWAEAIKSDSDTCVCAVSCDL